MWFRHQAAPAYFDLIATTSSLRGYCDQLWMQRDTKHCADSEKTGDLG